MRRYSSTPELTSSDISLVRPSSGFLLPFRICGSPEDRKSAQWVESLRDLRPSFFTRWNCLACLLFGKKRRALTVWLLVITVSVGVTAVSLIVLNIGARYRLRYPYGILIVLLGARGIIQTITRRRSDRVNPGPFALEAAIA